MSGAWTTTQMAGTAACSTANTATCPASLADVQQGGTCGATFVACDYPEARCECRCPAGAPTACAPQTMTWQCDSVTTPACPAQRPRVGAPCAQPSQSCSYDGEGGAACWGDQVECTGGVWVSPGGAGC
jgi:hypothetical protein